MHQAFLKTYNTTAHAGLIKDGFATPIPLVVLGDAKGRRYSEDVLAQKFSHALFPRTTNHYGCVTLHHYHFYVAEGLPQTQVLLWVYEDQLRAVVDSVVLAAYHCRYDGHTRHVRDICHGIVYTTRFTSPQGTLVPRHAEESLVVYRPKAPRRQGGLSLSAQQLWLFELMHTA